MVYTLYVCLFGMIICNFAAFFLALQLLCYNRATCREDKAYKVNTYCFPRLLDGGSRVLPKGLFRPPDEGLIPSDGLLRLKWTPGLNGIEATT